jgi:putative inorganic carbon (HCO3(-)) transporter
MSRLLFFTLDNKNSIRLWFTGGIILFVSIFCLVFAIWGISGCIILLISVVAPTMVFAIFKYPKFGITFYLMLAYLLMYVLGFGINFPLGTLMDGILLLLIISFFFSQKVNPQWTIFKNPISIVILIWISYNIIQVINPNAESRLAWVYTIRSVAGVMLSYFVFNYYINSIQTIRRIIKIWLALSVFAALYAMKQEYFGFFDYEQRAIDNNPLGRSLLFINGHWRKSAIFSDPVAFSYNMVASTILCISLIFGPTTRRQKIILGCLAALFLNVMLYSGTRAAYVLVPAAMALLVVLKFNKQILLYFSCFALILVALIFVPTSSPSIQRFQTAFRPSDDASYNVREVNQKRIQPFIKSHPIGGGLGATGVWGVRFAPNSFLAQFPPDSGYVRVAVELGWVGLFLICTLFFVILKSGIENYFNIVDAELRSYCLAALLIIFAISVGNFPQEAIVQFPLSVYFYMLTALLNITARLDQKKSVSVQENTTKLRAL